jgi:hypothetical protein
LVSATVETGSAGLALAGRFGGGIAEEGRFEVVSEGEDLV